MYTSLKSITPRIFELDLKHCTLTENLPLVYIKDILIGTVISIHLRDQMMCDTCGMHEIGDLGFPRPSAPWSSALTL